MKRFFVLSCFLFTLQNSLTFSQKITIELKEQFILDQRHELIGVPQGMAVDDRDNVFVTDSVMHDVKIYDHTGRLIKIFGRKGGGPGEFLMPYAVDCYNDRFCVQDVGHYKYFVFDREFKEITKFFYLVDGDRFILRDDKIITNDYFREKDKEFRGVILDFRGRVISALVPISFSPNDGWNRITGSKAFIDVSKEGEIFFVKEREVKFYKYDEKGKLLKEFGNNPSLFVPCQETKEFRHALYTSDADRKASWDAWRQSATWVSGIFVMDDFLGIVIRKFDNKRKIWESHVQCYDLDGAPLGNSIKLQELGASSEEGFFMDSNQRDRIDILEVRGDDAIECRVYRYTVKKE